MKCFMTNQDCIHEKEISGSPERLRKDDWDSTEPEGEIFVISPFGYPYDDLYKYAIHKLSWLPEIKVERADKAMQLGFVMCQRVCKRIRKADLVIVDITEANPNVYYELGLAMGFAKRIVFLRGEASQKRATDHDAWSEFLKRQGIIPVCYTELEPLLDVQGNLDQPPAESRKKLKSALQNMIAKSFSSGALTAHLASADSYFDNQSRACRQILSCIGSSFSDRNLLIRSAQKTVEGLEKSWEFHDFDMRLAFVVEHFLNEMAPCKVIMIDVTHYNGKISTIVYWILGLAHALGRDTIPIRNRERSDGITPFDVRGLYQIYFDRIIGDDSFSSNLREIMREISKNYDQELREYPQRHIWDKVIKQNREVEVYTFGRGVDGNNSQRGGGRTNVDTWDYQAVTELTSFLGQRYREATVTIQAPEDMRAKQEEQIKQRSEVVKTQLGKARKNDSVGVIIGSPDVSDYAELLLAQAYGIKQYERLHCSKEGEQCRGSTCIDKKCIGKCGYIFYKSPYYKSKEHGSKQKAPHPRERSFCYRDAQEVTEQRVLWYGKPKYCLEGVTYGVITVFFSNPLLSTGSPRKGGHYMQSVIVLSGFTGVATYGLASLLSGKAGEEQAYRLQKEIKKFGRDAPVQILVRVLYTQSNGGDRDTRKFQSVIVEEVQPLLSVEDSMSVFAQESAGAASSTIPAKTAAGRARKASPGRNSKRRAG